MDPHPLQGLYSGIISDRCYSCLCPNGPAILDHHPQGAAGKNELPVPRSFSCMAIQQPFSGLYSQQWQGLWCHHTYLSGRRLKATPAQSRVFTKPNQRVSMKHHLSGLASSPNEKAFQSALPTFKTVSLLPGAWLSRSIPPPLHCLLHKLCVCLRAWGWWMIGVYAWVAWGKFLTFYCPL